MIAYENPMHMICGACGSVLLIQRMEPGTKYLRVTCLSKSCPEGDKPHAYYPPEIELSALPAAQPAA